MIVGESGQVNNTVLEASHRPRPAVAYVEVTQPTPDTNAAKAAADKIRLGEVSFQRSAGTVGHQHNGQITSCRHSYEANDAAVGVEQFRSNKKTIREEIVKAAAPTRYIQKTFLVLKCHRID